jgi:PAS domain S-box-containing protein
MAESRANLREDLLEAALSALEEGMVLLDAEGLVLIWNAAASAITGYTGAEMLTRTMPDRWYAAQHSLTHVVSGSFPEEKPSLVELRHAQGHSLPAMLRRIPLRDALGRRFGTLLRFHPVEDIDTLPHGEFDEDDTLDPRLEDSQAGMEARLDEAWQEWKANAVPFGLIWLTVDQAAGLRRTHGRDAFEAMLTIVERTLVHGLRPAEVLGRWGSHEFLVLCHERSLDMLRAHGQHLAALVHTADFRWWGDRVELTASFGLAQAGELQVNDSHLGHAETLSALLRRAQVGAGSGSVTAISGR